MTTPQGDILIVDDIPENLQVLGGMLKEEGYAIRPAPGGRIALEAARRKKPDLVLLDICMPEMDGYEVCRLLKEDPLLRDVPVIFLSALSEPLDKVKAFSSGGVDYITKPFHFQEVAARVRTHIELCRNRGELQQLLSKTFVASLRTLMDVLSIMNPAVFDQTNRLKRYMRLLAQNLGIEEKTIWHFELAAMLSQLGCATLPADLLLKKQQGTQLTAEEENQFRRHPELGAELIQDIPRLEKAVAIIRRQHGPLGGAETPADIALGGRLLQILLEYDYACMGGSNPPAALFSLRDKFAKWPDLLTALRQIVETEARESVAVLAVSELSAGMILMENVMTTSGMLVLNRANELSPNLVSLLKHYAANHTLKEPIKVLLRRVKSD